MHKRMSIFNLRRFVTTFEGSMNVSYNKNLLLFVTIADNTSTTVYLKSNYFDIKFTRHSFVKLTIVLDGIPVFLVRYGIKFRPVLLYKDTVSRYFN